MSIGTLLAGKNYYEWNFGVRASIVQYRVPRYPKEIMKMEQHFSGLQRSLFRNKGFALNEMFQRNTSKFAIFYV